MLDANNRDIFDILPRLTAYHYPENIILPQGFSLRVYLFNKYLNVTLFTSRLYSAELGYWYPLLEGLANACHAHCSQSQFPGSIMFPTLRALMEMCITYDFTTVGALSDQQELQVAAMEKQAILEFETHLPAASTKTIITENNSLLLSQV